ncbi:MAG: DNA-3-methyladenine glycosylase I [Actinomycetota bacterium]
MNVEPTGWCSWANSSPQMRAYHDEEWGMPTADDRHLFEKVCLEAFQCGLSWSTVLARRERLREVFANFAIDELSSLTNFDIDRLVTDPTIIRHRKKIEAVLTNARACRLLIDQEESLGRYLWSFAPNTSIVSQNGLLQSTSAESIELSKDLKLRGWTFVGPTTMYALMQSVGMVNDHDHACPSRQRVEHARAAFAQSHRAGN